VLLLASQLLTPPLPLDALGMPGCKLFVDSTTSVSIGFTFPAGGPWTMVARDLDIPVDPLVLDAVLFAQWLNLETGTKSNALGVTTSNATRLQVASALPPGTLASVVSDEVAPPDPFPSSGRIEPGRAPVTRFVLR